MSGARLPTHVEASALLRRLASTGDFGTVLRKGDPDRGSLLLLISSRGVDIALLERVLDISGDYVWQRRDHDSTGTQVPAFLEKRARFDADAWVLELDIADPERFIAETIASG